MAARYHIDDEGNARECVATVKPCPKQHGESPEAAREAYEASMSEHTFAKLEQKASPREGSFSLESYYGQWAPREVQLEALNSVAQALEEEEATQLVAACGTGKTYMNRQLLEHFMGQEGASGVGVILTSSIKLAADTASDLRPESPSTDGGYDHSFGTFGRDYEVIEVHSDARPFGSRQSVREEGVISVDRIYEQWRRAQEAGKKVVIVSTYDSVGKVQEAQARFLDQASVEADLLVHDEAHNILGQQTPTTVASEENELTAYTGFHNEIPGALQSRRRLYATATPVVRELPEDDESPESLEEAIATAQAMKAGDQRKRVTYYSDDEAIVGRVSGFISQEEAITAECLAKPEYSLRETGLQGEVKDFREPVVNPDGTLVEREESRARNPLTPQTYGAVKATLEALAADPSEEGQNTATNVLAYVGSIPQAEGFKEAFKAVALAEAGALSLQEAEARVNDPDPEFRRQARMRLLAAHAEVKAAHSSTDGASVRERKAAFAMFSGKAVEEGPWTPHKRVLANVDIFSEGVSIPEIDAVVISDDEKCSERAMTQAIGRALRVVPGNSFKKTGHVIVPSVRDGGGTHLNEASVHLAAYGATRVERGATASKLRGEAVGADERTVFTRYEDGRKGERVAARKLAQEAVTDVVTLAAANEALNAHQYHMKEAREGKSSYRDLSQQEQYELVKSRIAEKAEKAEASNRRKEAAYLRRAHQVLSQKTPGEYREMARNARVLAGALATGDMSSLNSEVSKKLITAGVLTTTAAVADITLEEKRAFLKRYEDELSFAVFSKPAKMTPEHAQLRAAVTAPLGLKPMEEAKLRKEGFAVALGRGGHTPATTKLLGSYREALQDEAFVEAAFSISARGNEENLPILGTMKRGGELKSTYASLEATRLERQQAAAVAGEQSYSVDPSKIRKTGVLTSNAIRALLAEEA